MLCSSEADGSAGFTLIEVLVALTIVVTSLSAIATLVATSARGTRSMTERWARVETARALAAGLPNRDQLTTGHLAGELAGHRWRIDVAPFQPTGTGTAAAAAWTPELIVVTVRSPSGGSVEVPTVRLRRTSR